jgi:two-component system, sensor histidine kinase
MVWQVPYPLDRQYYFIGLPLVLLFLFGMMRLLAKQSLSIALWLLVASGVVFYLDIAKEMRQTSGTSVFYHWSSLMCYLASFNLIGFAISVGLERVARHSLIQYYRTDHFILENDRKAKFIHKSAHQLRSDTDALLNATLNTEGAIKIGNKKALTEGVGEIIQRINNMDTGINLIMDLFLVDSWLVDIEYSAVPIKNLLEGLVHKHSGFAKKQKVELNLSYDQNIDMTFVHSHPGFLKEVVNNLIQNAIKYSDNKKTVSSVTIRLKYLADDVRLTVADNGIGIPGEAIKRIFDPYVRATIERKGTGLGLYYVKTVIDRMMGHKISVKSKIGQWTVFTLTLPIGRIEEYQPPEKHHHPLNGKYVLIVDDKEFVVNQIREWLEKYDVLCESAKSYEDLLERLPDLDRTPDLLLTDYLLPNRHNANHVIKATKSKYGDDLPFVVMSGHPFKTMQDPGMRWLKILRKPLKEDKCIKRISTALGIPFEDEVIF